MNPCLSTFGIRDRIAIVFTIAVQINILTLATPAFSQDKPNVLFIAVDDLRPELTSFGKDRMVTPNFDRLARRGTRFSQAYCMVPTCGASRAALMTGIRPTRERFRSYLTRADEDAPEITTLNAHFKKHGYNTISFGKVFHHIQDSANGWSERPMRPSKSAYATAKSESNIKKNKKGRPRGPSWEDGGDVPDNTYSDGAVADLAIKKLERLSTQPDQPFFFAVGFTKPHLPFVAPGKYYKQYPASEVRLPTNYFPPTDAPVGAVHQSGELRAYTDIPAKGVLSKQKAKELIRGYHAATSYTDAHIGRLLDALDKYGLSQNTIVVLWGDHGWNLGEHTMWCKHSCFETSLRSPLVIAAPESTNFKPNQNSKSLVEFIDIYPTLCDLTSIPAPEHLEGVSLVPILKDADTKLKKQAVSRFKNGDSIKTERFRYTMYRNKKGDITGHMLYDHQQDPNENINLANQQDYQATVLELRSRLKKIMSATTDSVGKPRKFRYGRL